MFSPDPMLQMGISINLVVIFISSVSNTLTRIVKAFSFPISLLSSIINENLFDLHKSVVFFSSSGEIAWFNIVWVVLVLLQLNFLAISESGKFFFTQLRKMVSNQKWQIMLGNEICEHNFCFGYIFIQRSLLENVT